MPKPNFAADTDFRQRKTKAASNQAFSGLVNIGLYQISLFLRKIDKDIYGLSAPTITAGTYSRITIT
jgi:hypothetical protein